MIFNRNKTENESKRPLIAFIFKLVEIGLDVAMIIGIIKLIIFLLTD